MKRIFLFALFARHCTWENVCVCWEIKRAAIFFSPFQRSTRGGSSRRINAFVSRAIGGVSSSWFGSLPQRESQLGGGECTRDTSRDYCKIYCSSSFLLGQKRNWGRGRGGTRWREVWEKFGWNILRVFSSLSFFFLFPFPVFNVNVPTFSSPNPRFRSSIRLSSRLVESLRVRGKKSRRSTKIVSYNVRGKRSGKLYFLVVFFFFFFFFTIERWWFFSRERGRDQDVVRINYGAGVNDSGNDNGPLKRISPCDSSNQGVENSEEYLWRWPMYQFNFGISV